MTVIGSASLGPTIVLAEVSTASSAIRPSVLLYTIDVSGDCLSKGHEARAERLNLPWLATRMRRDASRRRCSTIATADDQVAHSFRTRIRMASLGDDGSGQLAQLAGSSDRWADAVLLAARRRDPRVARQRFDVGGRWLRVSGKARGRARATRCRRGRLIRPICWSSDRAASPWRCSWWPGCNRGKPLTPAGLRTIFITTGRRRDGGRSSALRCGTRSAPRWPRPASVTGIVHRACNRAGLPRIGAHRLRHTAATQMLRAGASLPEIAQVLRHRSPNTTAIYAKVDRRALAEVGPCVAGGGRHDRPACRRGGLPRASSRGRLQTRPCRRAAERLRRSSASAPARARHDRNRAGVGHLAPRRGRVVVVPAARGGPGLRPLPGAAPRHPIADWCSAPTSPRIPAPCPAISHARPGSAAGSRVGVLAGQALRRCSASAPRHRGTDRRADRYEDALRSRENRSRLLLCYACCLVCSLMPQTPTRRSTRHPRTHLAAPL